MAAASTDARSAPRRIGRILSLDFPLPGPLVDNFNFLTAPAFFDYDAIVVDPAALSLLIEGAVDGSLDAESFGGRAIRNVPAQPQELSLAEVLLRRRDETRALLAHGGIVACFAVPATAHTGIDGIERLDDYYWLREPSNVASDDGFGDEVPATARDAAQRSPDAPPSALTARMTTADGAHAGVTDFEHPLASFVESQAANIAYRAYFDVEPTDVETHAVFAESPGGMAVAIELPAESGRVIFLPVLRSVSGDARYTMSDMLQAGIRRALGVIAEGRAPGWAAEAALPGIEEQRTALEAARTARDAADAALAAAEQAYDERARYQRLLWQEGALGIEDVVVDALRLIGFDVYADQTASIELRTDIGAVLVEVEASEYAVGMAAHHRLRQRIERAIEQRGTAPRALLIVNGFRLQTPDARPQQVSDAVRTAAETMRYCIATSASLFAAVAAQLSGDDDAVRAYREHLLTTDGIVDATPVRPHAM